MRIVRYQSVTGEESLGRLQRGDTIEVDGVDDLTNPVVAEDA